MKKTIIILFSIASFYSSNAQEYAFSILNQPYQTLDTNNASFKPVYGKLNHFSDTWGGVSQIHDVFDFPIPFKRVSTNTTIDRFSIGFNGCGAAYQGNEFGIGMTPSTRFSRSNYGVCDRAYDSTIGSELYKAKSYIGYMVEGLQPNRILKIEYNNCKFYKSKPQDSLYVQVWMYEKDNSIEFHYGPSSITTNYDSLEGYSPKALPVEKGMVTGLLLHEGNYYRLEGNPISPIYRTYENQNQHPYYTLSALPPNGTVYRFDPNAVSVQNTFNSTNTVYPNPVKQGTELNIELSDPSSATIELYNIMGQQMRILKTNGESLLGMDVQGLEKGTYIMILKIKDNAPIQRKITIQ
jgi:hypothetical protein